MWWFGSEPMVNSVTLLAPPSSHVASSLAPRRYSVQTSNPGGAHEPVATAVEGNSTATYRKPDGSAEVCGAASRQARRRRQTLTRKHVAQVPLRRSGLTTFVLTLRGVQLGHLV